MDSVLVVCDVIGVLSTYSNINNNNNTWDNVYGAVIMTQVIARVQPVYLTNTVVTICHVVRTFVSICYMQPSPLQVRWSGIRYRTVVLDSVAIILDNC